MSNTIKPTADQNGGYSSAELVGSAGAGYIAGKAAERVVPPAAQQIAKLSRTGYERLTTATLGSPSRWVPSGPGRQRWVPPRQSTIRGARAVGVNVRNAASTLARPLQGAAKLGAARTATLYSQAAAKVAAGQRAAGASWSAFRVKPGAPWIMLATGLVAGAAAALGFNEVNQNADF